MATDAIHRALEEVAIRAQGGVHSVQEAEEVAVATVSAALQVDELARDLFVIDSDQPRDFAIRIWNEARDDSPVKRLFLTHAMKLRVLILGGDG
jgi:hypothetical protein